MLPVDKDVYRFVTIDEAHAYRDTGNTWYAALDRIIEVVARFGLRPVQAPLAPESIGEDDLGVVCYQVVLPS